MKVMIEKDYETMSETAKNILLGHMSQAKRVNVSITAGKTPLRLYEKLVEVVKNSQNYENIHYYNFDEVPFEGQQEGLTITELKKLYFSPANIPFSRVHPLTVENYEEQDSRIDNVGGIDVMLIGMGADGHFCANLPTTTSFGSKTYRRKLTGKEIWYESSAIEGTDEFVTMGPVSLFRVKHLVMIVSGKEKASMVKKVLFGSVTEDIPASILQLHPNFTVVLDEDAASELNQ